MAEQSGGKGGRGRAVATIVLVTIVIGALVALAGWYLFYRGGNDEDEREAYEKIVRLREDGDYLMMEEAINEYFDMYNSDAFHYSQLKDLSDRFFAEYADWLAVEGADEAYAIRGFLDVHPDGFFRQRAENRLDSLDFVEAVDVGTRGAVEHYMELYPQGKYVDKAREVLEQLEREEQSELEERELEDEEREEVLDEENGELTEEEM